MVYYLHINSIINCKCALGQQLVSHTVSSLIEFFPKHSLYIQSHWCNSVVAAALPQDIQSNPKFILDLLSVLSFS